MLSEGDFAKVRSDLKVFAKSKSKALSNDTDCQKGKHLGCDNQVANQVDIVVCRSAHFGCAPHLRPPAQHSLERSPETASKASAMHTKYQLCPLLFAVECV